MNLVVAALIAVVLLGGGGWYVYSTMGADTEVKEEATKETENKAEPLSGSGTFESLLALGESITCDIAYMDPETGTDATGTVYVAGDHMRGDFVLTHEGQVFNSHMIKTDTTLYTWTESSMGDYAMKMSLEASNDTAGTDAEPPVDWDQNVTYECSEWNRDDSLLTPPSDIDFMDPSTMMQDMMERFNVPQ